MKKSNVLNTNISTNDEMMKFIIKNNVSEDQYFKSGKKDLEFFVDSIKKHRQNLFNDIELLEYGCGHGRISRYVDQYFNYTNYVVADVWDDAVGFCSQEFHAIPFVISKNSPISKINMKFDVIMCYSVFSHLGPMSFEDNLCELRKVLNDGGLLLFSVKGERLAHERGISLEKGYKFLNVKNETDGRLSPEEYGGMFVSETFVAAMCFKARFRIVEFAKRNERQDVYVVENI